MTKSIKIGMAVAGTFIGAGFATGKEIMVFFKGNTPYFTFLLIASIVIMAVASLIYFNEVKKNGENKILKIIFLTFSAGCYIIMIACGGQTLYDTLQIDYRIGIIITYLITTLIMKFGIEGVYKFNMIVTPVILIYTIIIAFAGAAYPVMSVFSSPAFNSLLYSGYNILAVLPFVSAISKDIDKKAGFRGILLGFITVLIASVAIKLLLNNFFDMVIYENIPVLKIVSLINPYLSYIYSVVLYSAILTTAVSVLYVLTKGKRIFMISAPLVMVSFLGFTTLLEKIYTYFGYVGIVIILLIIIRRIYNGK